MTVFRPEEELLPNVVDYYAKVRPDQLYAEYPRSPTSYDEGFRPISYRAFANAINGIAHWLTKTLGPGNGENLAYIGPNDLRYPALVLGAVKAGYCMFLPSPRNSIAAHKHLLETLNCTKILAPVPRPPFITAILDALPLSVYDIPSVDELLATDYPHFEYTKSYPADRDDKFAIVHTSGSTGLPKPIIWKLSTGCAHTRMFYLYPPEGFENQHGWSIGKRQFMPLPPFHAAGLASLTFLNIPANVTCILPTAAGLPTASALVEAMKQTPMDMASLVPSIVQELAQEPELLDYCAQNLEYCFYMGGDLPQAIGDKVAAKIRLYNHYGSSEVGLLAPIYAVNKRDRSKDWRYVQFHPDVGAEFRQATETEYELVVVRTPTSEKYLMPFTIFPDQEEFFTRDLFVRHPDPNKSDLWRWSSRSDDVIVFLNGEKTNPVSMEQHILAANPGITGVVVAGAQRFQASLIIEYGGQKLHSTEWAATIESIWPSIEEANKACPAHARISRTHILFTAPDKPFPRAGKGTIQRAAALTLYSSELETLYAHADRLGLNGEDEPTGPGRVSDVEQISEFIVQTLASITGWTSDQIKTSENFFHLGLDSLQTITATRSFKRGFDLPSFSPNLIYLHPSLSSLTHATLKLMEHDQVSEKAVKEAQLQEREEILNEFIAKIDGPHIDAASENLPTSHTVLLTGSTGTLGTYILDVLLKDPSVSHIHCLNRRADSAEIQRQKSTFYHLDSTLDSSRVTFWHADLSQNDLGLEPESLKLLQESTTAIVHNAWNVNFNLSLPSFNPDLLGLVNLINFTATASNAPNLFFLSSISSVMGHETDSHLTPESIISTDTPAPNGYATSKYIAERLLGHAAQTRGIRTSFARVGQVAGAVRTPGLWNKAEYFPSLVKSSLQIGAVPDTVGATLDRIDWVPIDLLADVLTGLALRESQPSHVNVYHPLNLHPTTWSSIIATIADELSQISGGKHMESVDLSEWVQRVRQDIETSGGSQRKVGESDLRALLEKNPAAKLIEFFEGVVSVQSENILDTQGTASFSEKLRSIEGIKEEWIRKWVREWM
ncbi:NRPS-like enzyme [Penicillium cataractarum]|uniref:NRPS-like enzyme n=1 Tax=Penicillium cataractarum TaxID=2100454 RepID=A0A9W9UUH1_9EURO|nr:NRPS-like enzyme [Penicillium cataractarum]KAJ5355196.1 NRPS-like enzyme [Penicillium cataractarum]